MNEPAINAPTIPEADPITPAPDSKDVRDKWTLFVWRVVEWIAKQIRAIKLTIALIRKPKTLVLTKDQAEYVQSLFLSNVMPEDISRAVASMYGREAFPYFKVVNEKMDGLEFAAIDYDIQGLELVRSAMIALGAIEVKPDGDYYTVKHPMVKHLSKKIIAATIPDQGGLNGKA